ncbi:MAG: transglutaminase family protein [Solirubrobacterales bacterium]|jgi:transglutaminase-like putative cysteine protease|nr:transglutaminase family protein [Solirubrobacterales bacterium]
MTARTETTDTLTLKVGCQFEFESSQSIAAIMQVAPCPQPGVQVEREAWDTGVDHHAYIDQYGNRCERLTIAEGASRIAYEAQLVLTDPEDHIDLDVPETPVAELPDDVMVYVMPSRFVLPDELGHDAWQRFGSMPPGGSRVQAIMDFVHDHLGFDHSASNPWTTAKDVYIAEQGVCRDYAHLAISFCRALNIPARYVFGYIPAIGPGAIHEEMDFAAWCEVWLDGRWHTFDARNNTPRTGRVVVGRGRDAVDVALITSFGPLTLTGFKVIADAVDPTAA